MTQQHKSKAGQSYTVSHASKVALYALLMGGLSYIGALGGTEGAIANPTDDAIAVPSAHDLLDPVIKSQPLPPAPAPVAPPSAVAPITASPTVEFSPNPGQQPSSTAAPASSVPGNVPGIDLSDIKADIPTIDLGNQGSSQYVDPTDYGLGATSAPGMVPEIVLTERSTGCKTVLQQGQGIPSHLCGRTTTQRPGQVATAGNPASSGPTALIPLQPINSVKIGPLSIGANGVQITRRLSVQDYYSRTDRPKSIAGNGNASLMFPLSVPAMVSSPFGLRQHPIFGTVRMHTGTDLAAPMGTPVVAAYSGRVAISDFMGGYGLTVVIGHGEKASETLYGHLSEVFVTAGEWVEQGEVIGRVGSTGNSTGPHLHFELRKQTANGWAAVNSGTLLQQGLANIHQGFHLGAGFSIADASLINPDSGEVVKLSVPKVLQQGKYATKDDVETVATAPTFPARQSPVAESPSSLPTEPSPSEPDLQPGPWVSPKELMGPQE